MSTIKELAETCGVSEQAIRKWCARNQVAKDVAQRYIIDKTTETAILQHYGKDTRNQVAQPTETSCETSETMKEIIEMLRKELEAKDKRAILQREKEAARKARTKRLIRIGAEVEAYCGEITDLDAFKDYLQQYSAAIRGTQKKEQKDSRYDPDDLLAFLGQDQETQKKL